MFVLFQPDLENCKSKGVETCPCLPFFHTKHCWPSFMYYVRKICIHYANFHDCNFFGKHCELLWRQTFFSLEALSLGIILIDCFFSCVHCLWIINKIVMYHSNSWNSLWPTKGYTIKNPSYTLDQRNDKLEKESRFPYKKTMHINYSSWL